jgi:hypothetical protein
MLNPREAFGDLDVTFVPQHSQSYEGLSPGAQERKSANLTGLVVRLRDVIKLKTAAARPTDLDALPALIRITQRERQQRRDSDYGLEL